MAASSPQTKNWPDLLPITIAGTAVPTAQYPKILGVTLDLLLTFNILKALAGSSWGKEKEVLKTTYTAISKFVLSYAAPRLPPRVRPSYREPKTLPYAPSQDALR